MTQVRGKELHGSGRVFPQVTIKAKNQPRLPRDRQIRPVVGRPDQNKSFSQYPPSESSIPSVPFVKPRNSFSCTFSPCTSWGN